MNLRKRQSSKTKHRLKLEPLESRQLMAIVVDTLIDEFDGEIIEDASLRDAIAAAQHGETIEFGVTGQIDLTLGALPVNKGITINGPGPAALTIDAGGNSGIFEIDGYAFENGNDVVVSGVSLTGGSATHGGAVLVESYLMTDQGKLFIDNAVISGNTADFGGGISLGSFDNTYYIGKNAVATRITNTTISGNTANVAGGGVYSRTCAAPHAGNVFCEGGIQITDSNVSGNSALGIAKAYERGGGGIYAKSVYSLQISRSTIYGNQSYSNGGGVSFVDSEGQLEGVTFSSNSAAGDGGGVSFSYGEKLDIVNSTISGNQANGAGGGVHHNYSSSELNITSSTIVGNEGNGGGLAARGTNLLNSIFADNVLPGGTASDISGFVNSGGSYNLISVNSGFSGLSNGVGGNQIGTTTNPMDPQLGPLAANGGPTLTHEPMAGSPVINSGHPEVPFLLTSHDQRGESFEPDSYRVQDGRIDIGAVETAGTVPTVPATVGELDFVFLVDESGSIDNIHDWLIGINHGQILEKYDDGWVHVLETELALNGVDARFGLATYAKLLSSNFRGHSREIGQAGSLFGTATEWRDAAMGLVSSGGNEDGWDGIEHVIAEYDFRDGAATQIMLVSDEGREETGNPAQNPITAAGVVATLRSKNTLFNAVNVSQFQPNGSQDPILFVDHDAADGQNDQQHPLLRYDDNQQMVVSGFFDAANGDFFDDDDDGNSNAGDRYVTTAWDTLGASYNINIVLDRQDLIPELESIIVDQTVDQVAAQLASGSVYGEVPRVMSVNVGGPATGEFSSDSAVPPNSSGSAAVTTTQMIDVNSASIPVEDPMDVFQSAREAPVGGTLEWNLLSTPTGGVLADGVYTVDLYFSEIAGAGLNQRVFDVYVEDQLLIDDYNPYADYTKISDMVDDEGRIDVDRAGANTGVVKSFEVEVIGGLDIRLEGDSSASKGPILSGFVARTATTGPTVTDVRIGNAGSSFYSFDAEDADGSLEQLRTVPRGSIDSVQLEFSEDVNVPSTLTLAGGPTGSVELTLAAHIGNVATWSLDAATSPFPKPSYFSSNGQFVIGLTDSSVTAVSDGAILDGDWEDPTSANNWIGTEFPSGDVQAGGDFQFTFSVVNGDADRDWIVDGRDFIEWNNHKFQKGTNWCEADWDGDALTDGRDFIIWNDHKFTSSIPAGAPGTPAEGYCSAMLQASPSPKTGLVPMIPSEQQLSEADLEPVVNSEVWVDKDDELLLRDALLLGSPTSRSWAVESLSSNQHRSEPTRLDVIRDVVFAEFDDDDLDRA